MPRLHTARFSDIEMERKHLELLFQSNSLHHLILDTCGFPDFGWLPPSRIRHLTLFLFAKCEDTEPLLGHCSANLEVLEITNHSCPMQQSTTLPPFPNLRKLKIIDESFHVTHLDTFVSLAPRLKVLKVYGRREITGLSALPGGLNRLTINRRSIWDGCFGTRPFVHLSHLHLTYSRDKVKDDCTGPIIPIIKDTFPNLTTLKLVIHWEFRDIALLLARHLPKVTRLELTLDNCPGMRAHDFDISPCHSTFAEPRGPLKSLFVNTSRIYAYRILDNCQSWVTGTALGTNPGLGGPYLQEVEVAFFTSWGGSERLPGRSFLTQKYEQWLFWGYSHGQIYKRSCVDTYFGEWKYR